MSMKHLRFITFHESICSSICGKKLPSAAQVLKLLCPTKWYPTNSQGLYRFITYSSIPKLPKKLLGKSPSKPAGCHGWWRRHTTSMKPWDEALLCIQSPSEMEFVERICSLLSLSRRVVDSCWFMLIHAESFWFMLIPVDSSTLSTWSTLSFGWPHCSPLQRWGSALDGIKAFIQFGLAQLVIYQFFFCSPCESGNDVFCWKTCCKKIYKYIYIYMYT